MPLRFSRDISSIWKFHKYILISLKCWEMKIRMLLNKLCQPILLCMHQHHSGSILVSFFTTATAQSSNLRTIIKFKRRNKNVTSFLYYRITRRLWNHREETNFKPILSYKLRTQFPTFLAKNCLVDLLLILSIWGFVPCSIYDDFSYLKYPRIKTSLKAFSH